MGVGTIFQANLNADKIYIDMTHLPDPVKHTFWLTIQNQSLGTLYFKMVCNLTSWGMDTPADGKLGSVGTGATKTFTPIITRSKPGAEATDSGNLKIEAYTDAGYTNKVAEDTLDVTAYVEDLESWTDVAKSTFDDGTTMGWTLASGMSISNLNSIEVGGYSAYRKLTTSGTFTLYAEKSVTLPSRPKIRVSFYMAFSFKNPYSMTRTGWLGNIVVKIDGNEVFSIPFIMHGGSIPKYTHTPRVYGWDKLTADLSAYNGQTKTVRIEYKLYAQESKLYSTSWLDDIVIAGKD